MAAPLTSAELAWVFIDEVLDPGSRHSSSIWEMIGIRVHASREEVEIRERHIRHQLHPDRLQHGGQFAKYIMVKLQSGSNPLIEAMHVCGCEHFY
jgi:hypothetical protein